MVRKLLHDYKRDGIGARSNMLQADYWRNNKEAWAVTALVAFALALRLGFMSVNGHINLNSDDANYITMARQLLHTGILGYAGNGVPNAAVMPGYPLFLAALLFVGSLNLVVFVQVILSTITVLFTYLIGRHVSHRVGLLAALLYAIYYPALWMNSIVMTEVLYATLFVIFTYVFIRALNQLFSWVWVGLLLGMLALLRPEAIIAPLFISFLMFWRMDKQDLIKGLIIMYVVVVAVLTPWWVRNYLLYDAFVPFSTEGGKVLLESTYYPEVPYVFLPDGNGELSTDALRASTAKQRMLAELRTGPGHFIEYMTWEKFTRLWYQPYIQTVRSPAEGELSSIYHILLFWLCFGGIAWALIERRVVTCAIMTFFATFTLLHIVTTVGLPRYMAPMIPLGCILAALFVVAALEHFFGERFAANAGVSE